MHKNCNSTHKLTHCHRINLSTFIISAPVKKFLYATVSETKLLWTIGVRWSHVNSFLINCHAWGSHLLIAFANNCLLIQMVSLIHVTNKEAFFHLRLWISDHLSLFLLRLGLLCCTVYKKKKKPLKCDDCVPMMMLVVMSVAWEQRENQFEILACPCSSLCSVSVPLTKWETE